MEIDPYLAQAYYSRGKAYEALGDAASAEADFATAASMGYYCGMDQYPGRRKDPA
ncbi:MAG: hypothetical protein JXA64_01120 [Candidatus Fermentibacteraceae bacterium]|nr:hypothetical protein [Candidatus Fermentibacteraceae bacterium]MBN2607687.1 hypothetical protein [Candidatus Fermentibacteraceae bacterium]